MTNKDTTGKIMKIFTLVACYRESVAERELAHSFKYRSKLTVRNFLLDTVVYYSSFIVYVCGGDNVLTKNKYNSSKGNSSSWQILLSEDKVAWMRGLNYST